MATHGSNKVRSLKIGDRVYDVGSDAFGKVSEYDGWGRRGTPKVMVLLDGEEFEATYYEFELTEAELDFSTIWGL